MLHYIDFRVLPDPESAEHQLMATLFARLHVELAQVNSQQIAVSFPGYKLKPLTTGSCLRLIGPAPELNRLMEHDWLKALRDHLHLSAIAPVPQHALHRTLRRVQAKSSPERLRRRLMRRHDITYDEALTRIPDSCAEKLALPFLMLNSSSTKQRFPLFLQLGPTTIEARSGTFNSYGLSSTATTPWF